MPPIEVAVADARSERSVELADYSASLTYSLGGHSATAQATVTPPRAGRYLVSARTALDASAGAGVALGESIAGRIVRTILGALAIGGLLAIAGIGLIVATAVRRNRAGRHPRPRPRWRSRASRNRLVSRFDQRLGRK